MLLTLWCMVVAIGSLFFFGLPIAAFFVEQNDEPSKIWLDAPLAGLSFVILTLQNLVYLDVRIGISTPWLWLIGIGLWLWLAKKRRLGTMLSTFPRSLMFTLIAVYLLHSLGLVFWGATFYVARGWVDEFNYTAIAHFLNEYPFSLTLAQIPHQPILVKAIELKLDRIGVMVFQGFLASSTFTDPKTVFEPFILLAPVLTALVVYQFARRLTLASHLVVFATVAAGVLPALTSVHIETFLSQALGIPFLLLLPLSVSDALERPSWKRLLFASLILAGGTTIYTEFYPIFLVMLILVCGIYLYRQPRQISRCISTLILVPVSALLLNSLFIRSIFDILTRVSMPAVLSGIYPWAFTIKGLGRLWIGDAVFAIPSSLWLSLLHDGLAISLVLAASLGLAWVAWRRKDTFSFALLTLVAMPFVIRILDDQHPYQFYKLLLSISPLLPLGIAALIDRTPFNLKGARWMRVSLIGLVLVFSTVTGFTTITAGVYPIGERSSGANRLLTPGSKEAQARLANLRGQVILIVCSDSFMNAWLAYFARYNRVWVAYSRISDASTANIQTFDDLPDTFYLLLSAKDGQFIDHSIPLIWSVEPYSLLQVSDRNWVTLLDIKNLNGIEEWGGEYGLWLGSGDTEISFLSNKTGTAIVTADFTPGPSLPETRERSVAIVINQNYSTSITLSKNGAQSFVIPIVAGLNRLVMRPLDQATVRELSNGDARPLLLGMRGLQIHLK